VPGTIGISPELLADWAGWIVDYQQPLYLIVSEPQLAEVTRVLRKIGVEKIGGYFDAEKITQSAFRTESFDSATPHELKDRIANAQVSLIDVRRDTEWTEGHVETAEHHFLGRLRDAIPNINKSKPIVLQCRTGKRSAIAASLLQAAGVKDVINMIGGMIQWQQSGLPVVRDDMQVVA
jgi:hydroxyacylglutathione hydrolase